MTIDAINSLLFPPFLFMLFFCIISGLFYPARAIADETRMMRKTRPAIAPSEAYNRPRIAPRSSAQKSSSPGMRLSEVLDELEEEEEEEEAEAEQAEESDSENPKIPQRI